MFRIIANAKHFDASPHAAAIATDLQNLFRLLVSAANATTR